MKPKQKIISLLLTICLVAGLMPTAAFAAGTDTGKAIQFVDSGTAANISGGQADNIYFGKYQQSRDGNSGYNIDPIKWRVLENANGQLFLLSDQNLDVFKYHVDNERVTWATSTMRSWLNGYGAAQNTGRNNGIDYTDDNFIDTAFFDGEQGAIVETTVVNDDNPDNKTEGGEDTNDKIFLLSVDEARNSSYFADDNSRKGTNTAYVANGGKIDGNMSSGVGAADYWWLRSPGRFAKGAARVGDDGGVDSPGCSVFYDSIAVRPAFNLDLTSVLFTSAAEGGKIPAAEAADAIFEIGDYNGKEWKLTLLDSSREFAISNATANSSDGTIAFSYSGAQTGTNEYISAVVKDNGAITHYGRILQLDGTENGERGTASPVLPTGVTLDNDTKLYVFNEQYNGGEKDNTKLTDYASNLIAVNVDTTAPTLTGGGATRTSETAATVKFTSNEAGSYYYTVVESGADEPDVNSSGTGTACDTTEQIISLTNLTAGAKDIYIVVKDAAGNVSDQLIIKIPAYVAPSYGISANPSALNFESKTEDYEAAPAAQTVTIRNTGNQNITLDQPTANDFNIGTLSTTELTAGGTATFTVQPKTGLTAENHSETLNISGSNGVSAQVALSFTVNWKYNGGGGYIPTIQKPTIEAGEGVKVTLSADGTVATITVEAGYELADVVLNGTSKGKVTEVKGLKTGDKLVVTAAKKATEPTREDILATLADQKLVARSKVVTMKNGKKAVRITWYNANGEMMEFDGVEIFRSVKRNSGYGKKPIFTSETDKYYNTAIKAGTKYYYKVRGFVVIDGQKYYTDWSLKAWRTVK